MKPIKYCFHSISFPSEWGQERNRRLSLRTKFVSIQLVSPASGDSGVKTISWHVLRQVSIQLVSPASGDFL